MGRDNNEFSGMINLFFTIFYVLLIRIYAFSNFNESTA